MSGPEEPVNSVTPADSVGPAEDLAGDPADGYPPIGDYGIVGDCRSAALVSRDGSLDWLCLPHFDSPSVFGALLDRRRGGRFTVRPAGEFTTERRYLPDTNVLETRFHTDSGRARMLDLMPVDVGGRDPENRRKEAMAADHEVLRLLEGLEGRVELTIHYEPRPNYGTVVPRLEDRGSLGHWCEHRGHALALRTRIPLRPGPGPGTLSGVVELEAGTRRALSLVYAHHEPAMLPPLGDAARDRAERTVRWWRRWVGRCEYQGPFREAVVRSALVLKLLTYAPSGAVIAAPTTSLPEAIGGVRNWDYRYCWLRDSSLVVQSLMDLGLTDEAESFLGWTLHTTRRSRPELQIMYDIHGEPDLEERELDHLEGYAGSRPVRVGNGAADQLQLDVYGEVLDAVHAYVRRGGSLDRTTGRMLADWGDTVCRRWREPDEGIWEIRASPNHHTFSKAMCWVALDRLLRLHEKGEISVPAAKFRRERDEIRRVVEERGYNEEIDSYVATFDGDRVDASLLLLGRYGYADPSSPRIVATCERIHERLGVNGFLYRYRKLDDGLPEGEGAFGICNFWGVECRCRQGAAEPARDQFARLCRAANDLGLYGEQFDPFTGAALGNFPQAFTHVGLIDAALTMDACVRHEGRRAAQLATHLETS